MIDPTDYRQRAELHRPKTSDELAAAARNMARDGYGDYTIASALLVDVMTARRLIGESPAR